MKKLTNEQAIEAYRSKHGDKYDYSEVEYKGADVKIRIGCPKHGVFEQRAASHKRGEGCPKCKADTTIKCHTYDLAEFVKRSVAVHGNSFDYTRSVYTKAKEPIDILCKSCNRVFTQIAQTHLAGHGCPSCSAKEAAKKNPSLRLPKPIRVREQDFLKTLNLPEHISYVDGSYKGVAKQIKLVCSKHGLFGILGVTARTAKYLCGGCVSDSTTKRQRHDLLSVIAKANGVHGQYTYNDQQAYKGNRTMLEITCPKHGLFKQSAMSHLHGSGCRACGYEKVANFNQASVSVGETEVFNFCKTLGNVEQSNRGVLYGGELDIYFPEQKLAIEFNGVYWHSEAVISKDRHLEKLERCLAKGVDLIQIFEDEWDNTPNIVKSVIATRLDIYEAKVYEEQTALGVVEPSEAKGFYDTNHIQGFVDCQKHYGLYYKNELVAMASYSEPRIIIGKSPYDLELVRFCTKLNTQVAGGLGKLMMPVADKSIVSYCDRRLFSGNDYTNAGFKMTHASSPSYSYVKHKVRHSRFKFQKHKLQEILSIYDKDLTEHQNMKNNGYLRIYDCGNFVMVKPPTL